MQKEVVICDRCGKQEDFNKVQYWAHIKVTSVRDVFEARQTGDIDLCSECYTEFLRFKNNPPVKEVAAKM